MGNIISFELFPIILNMSVTAGMAVLFLLPVRLLLKRAPKVFSYALWAVVLFRLLCPVSFTAAFSLPGLFSAPAAEATAHTTAVEYVPQNVVHAPSPKVELPVPGLSSAVNERLPHGEEQLAADPLEAPMALITLVWLAGMGVMAAYSVISWLRLRQQLTGAVPLRDNIWLADYIGSPFVMGILRPRIYLPSSLSDAERGYILLHEQHHIRRGDHIFKALAFLALCIHWFNPLAWLAFVLASRDMEMSCDEAVVRRLGEEIRADYSASLLSLATGRRIIAGTPLAFGEGDTRSRIRNLLRWKRPKLWLTLAAAVVCAAAAAACAGNPAAVLPPPVESVSPAEEQDHAPEQDAALQDLAAHLELSALGREFRDMDAHDRDALLAEYGALLEDYSLLARESTDGKAAYIVGAYTGQPQDSPLYRMYSVELGSDEQLVYPAADSGAVDRALVAGQLPQVGYLLRDSRLNHSDSGIILIQPKGVEEDLDYALSRYLDTPDGRAYIEDAAARGIAINDPPKPYLCVYLISERFGEIAEKIPLTEETAAAIQSEPLEKLPPGFGFCATLETDGETVLYSESQGVPRSVIDLAVEKCGYRFADPSYISGSVLSAQLDCDWLEAPIRADEADLPRLEEILYSAEFGYVGACGYGARLTLELTGGEKLTVFKGTDGCGSLVFGSYGGYFIGDRENTEFWQIFGLDPETKLPVPDAPAN